MSGALPSGLSFDATTCTISGIPTAPLSETQYTMTSTKDGQTYEGSFHLTVVSCSGTVVKVIRTYKSNAYKEWFTIKDKATQQVVMSVEVNSGQENNKKWTGWLCMNGVYEIEVGSTSMKYWTQGSFLYLKALLNRGEYETIARIHYSEIQGFPTSYEVNVKWSVAPHSQWSYKRNEVPTDWYGWETSDWTESTMGSYPAATNQIQLYKKTFNVASLTDVAGFVISLRYLYGCVIYMNGHEALRNGVTGDVTTSSLSSNAYPSLIYHQISLPVKTVGTDDTLAVNYLIQGENTIAIAIVAQTASQTASMFDCAVRLMGKTNARVFDYDEPEEDKHYKNIGSNAKSIAEQYTNYVWGTDERENYWTIAFSNDRREWISAVTVYLFYTSYQPVFERVGQFVVKARNSDSEEWTTIKEVTGLTWNHVGENKRIWLGNDKPYNQYRFANFASGDPINPKWVFSTLDLTADAIPAAIPELVYSAPPTITKDIAMTDLYPSVDATYYYDFTIEPALPTGLVLDQYSGKIWGIPTRAQSATTHTIMAKKYGGGDSTTTMEITVGTCSGNKSLITLALYVSKLSQLSSYKVFRGKTTNGDAVQSASVFETEVLNYGYFCLDHDVYTLVLNGKGNGRDATRWYLSIDGGDMVFEMGQIPEDSSVVSTTFSSLLPFQIDYSDWKLFNRIDAVVDNWNGVDFDDSGWDTKKAAEFGNHAGTIAYIRHEVSIPSIEDYHVLNVRMKYAGGVVAYFNGHIVARFNLKESFDASTVAFVIHDATAFSKFHVILPLVDAVSGKNVIAFEIHRAAGVEAIVFDATGVFGVNECSITVDSYSSTGMYNHGLNYFLTKEGLLNLTPRYGYLYLQQNFSIAWVVENLEGSLFNSFGIEVKDSGAAQFSLKGRWSESGEYDIGTTSIETLKNKHRTKWAMTLGYAGFKHLELKQTGGNSPSVIAFMTQYCVPPASGVCPANGIYPSVKNGEKSVVKCPRFSHGYKYRQCTNGVLGSDVTDLCEYDAPTDLAYPESSYPVYTGVDFSSGTPTYEGYIASFAVTEGTLPAGLTLDATTGVISGKATSTACADGCSVTITGSNPGGSATVSLTFTVLPPSIAYPIVGAGVHVVMGVPATIIPVITPSPSPFTAFEITGLPEGLKPDSATGVITGTASGGKQSVEVTVKGFLDDTNSLSFPFTLFVHDHNSVSALVPEGSSPSHILHLRARAAIASGALYLDSAYSAETLALTDLSMDAKEVKGVYAALPDPIYFIQASNLDIVVLKDVNPVVAFIGEDNVEAHFNTTSVCEESLDVECDIVKGSNVIVKEVDAESGNTFSEPAIIPLDRAKSYEM